MRHEIAAAEAAPAPLTRGRLYLSGLPGRLSARAVIAATAVLAFGSPPAGAAVPRADDRDTAVAGLRSAAATGSLQRVLTAVGAATADPARSPARPVRPLRAAVPARVPAAITDVLAAVLRADAEVAGALAPADRRSVAATLRALDRGALHALQTRSDGTVEVAPRVADAARRVDIGVMTRAASRIGAAVDRLLAAPLGLPAAARGEGPCDVADVPGVLCIAGDGAHEHQAHYRLVVDLGGDDLYTGATAAGGCVSEPATGSSCVAVNVDLGGRDRYTPAGPLPACEAAGFGPRGGVCGQGSGVLGVGILVDAAGDDVYEALTRVKGDDCLGGQFSICGVTTAQGAGRFGVGVLADLAGDDSYALRTPVPAADDPLGDRSVTVDGQGVGLAGAGVLWDAGGNDSYVVEGPATGFLTSSLQVDGWSTYEAQGVAVGGTGVILEAGGRDVYRMRFAPGPGAEDRLGRSPWGEGAAIGPVNAQGYGYGVNGSPVLGGIITGAGQTLYEIDAAARLRSTVNGHGLGPGGVIDDPGGDDVYRLVASTDAIMRRTCAGCHVFLSGVADPFAGFSVGRAVAAGQGYDGGRLHDAAGDDSYEVRGTARLHAVADDASAIVERLGEARAGGQGAGGRLLDAGGDDRYTLAAHHDVQATGDAASRAWARALQLSGQGNGGALIDRGGSDTYEALATSDVRPVEGAGSGHHDVIVQGLGGHGSLLQDVDDGEPDTFHADAPAIFDVCTGRHGTAPGWGGGQRRILGATGEESCSATGGRAVASSTAAPAPPATLTILPAAGSETGAFTVRLTGADGSPLAGRRVLVQPELRLGAPYYGVGPFFVWQPWDSGVQVVTDGEGMASGRVHDPSCPQIGTPCDPSRLAASFFGDAVAGPDSDERP